MNPSLPVRQETAGWSFIDQNDKEWRTIKGRWSSSLKSLGYIIMALACRIFCLKTRSDHFSRLSDYHSYKGRVKQLAWKEFGSNLINRSYGLCGSVKKVTDQKFKEWTDEVKDLDKSKLSLLKTSQSCSFGICLDFISRLKGKEINLNTIKSVSLAYAKGGTKEAQMYQIFYHALNSTEFIKMWNRYREECDKKISEVKKRWEADVDKVTKRAKKRTIKMIKSGVGDRGKVEKFYNKQTEAPIARIIKDAEEKIEKIFEEWWEKISQLNLSKRIAPLAEKIGCQVTLEQMFEKDTLPRLFKEKIQPGIYMVQNPESERTIVYVKKSEKKGYMLDPLVATARIRGEKEQFSMLWKAASRDLTHLGLKSNKEEEKLIFYKCT